MLDEDTLRSVSNTAAHLELAAIHVVKLQANARLRPESVSGKPGRFEIAHAVKFSHDEKRLECFVAYTVTLKAEADDTEWLVIAPTFRALYAIKEGSRLDTEDVKRFASINAVFNTWPYLREIVHTNAERMGFPGLVISLFKMNEQAPVPKANSPSPTSEGATEAK